MEFRFKGLGVVWKLNDFIWVLKDFYLLTKRIGGKGGELWRFGVISMRKNVSAGGGCGWRMRMEDVDGGCGWRMRTEDEGGGWG